IHFIVRIAAFGLFLAAATTLAWRACQRARTLVRAAHDRFIRFGNTGQMLGLHRRRRRQKSVPPTKGGIAMDPGRSSGLTYGLPINERLGKSTPSRAMAQAGQRRACKHVERTSAG